MRGLSKFYRKHTKNKKLLDKNADLTRTYGYVNIMLNKAAEVTEITPWVKILNKEEKTVA